MSNKIKDINIKSHTYYSFDDIVNIKIFDLNDVEIDESHTKIFLFTYYIVHVTIKDSKYVKLSSVFPLHLYFSKVNEYFE